MTDYMVWNSKTAPEGLDIPEGLIIRWVYDEEYSSQDSYDFGDEEETAKFVAEEEQALEDGRLVALGAIIEDEGDGFVYDSLWGIVTDGLENELLMNLDQLDIPTGLRLAEARYERARKTFEAAHRALIEATVRDAQSRL